MPRPIELGVVTALLAACGGYSKLEVDKIQTVAVTIDDPEQRFCAYAPVALRALVTYRDGEQVQSRAPWERTRGRLRTSEFQWAASHGTVDEDAVLRLPHDPLAWFDEPIAVSARVAARPELVGEGTMQPRFDCGGTLDLRGAPGARGGEAEDGGPGAPGPTVDVSLAYLQSRRADRLALVRVRRDDAPPEYFVIDAAPSAQPLVIDARGGDGGRGGQGVAGEDGVPGRDGAPGYDGPTCADATPGQDGTDGLPGAPGSPGRDGGPGGPGGRVVVRHDARSPELAELVQIRVDGGAGGAAGPGGDGGRGGQGGRGGPGGTGRDPNAVDPASTSCSAPAGAGGADGARGVRGPDGRPGASGPPGELGRAAVDVDALFADELARGVPVVTTAGAVP